jgi:hypothetical protein
MWAVYQKSDGRVVGLSIESDVRVERDEALRQVMGWLAEPRDPSEYDAFEIRDRGRFSALTDSIARGRAAVRPSRSGEPELVEEQPEASMLRITTSAQDLHPVDGVPLIPADGQSFVTITLTKLDEQARPRTRRTRDNDVIWLRTDNGTLREDRSQNPREMRSVTLAAGRASFRLYSEYA